MKLSKLNEIPYKRHMIDAFGGYNHNIRIGEGEFYDMKNLTSDKFPSLSPRKKRGIFRPVPEKPLGMISKDKFVYVDGSSIFIGDEEIPDFLDDKTEKSLVSMGAYIIILPDKKYINTQDTSDKGNIEVDVTIDNLNLENVVSFRPCDIDGVIWENPILSNETEEPIPIYRGKTAPKYSAYTDTLISGLLWEDTTTSPSVLRVYDEQSKEWVIVQTTYMRIYTTNIILSDYFKAGDGIFISGTALHYFPFKGTFRNAVVVENVIEGGIVVKGPLIGDLYFGMNGSTTGESIKFERKMPDMDFIIESENRLWGCKYGVVKVDGKDRMVNEIYASKLGDFKNWNCFAGISTDSYVVSVGTDGKFTGAISYLGHPLFFKENFIHKVYGNFPSNFQMQTTACRGVQYQSSKSLAIVNEMLIYKARNGICAYDGSLPVEISSQFGNERYNSAVGGVLGNKYYVSMKNSNNEYTLFVYDLKKQMWHKEDNTEAVMFCTHNDILYYIDRDTNRILSVTSEVDADGEIEPNRVNWSAETGIIGADSPDKKYISRIIMRMNLDAGTTFKLYADYDSLGVWEQLFSIESPSLKSYSIPIVTRRCDHMRLKFEGTGGAEIFSICKNIEEGSEI